MLPASYLTVWGPGALYAELYIGMCRALAAPWLGVWLPDGRAGARPYPPARSAIPTAASGVAPAPAASQAGPELPGPGALIIPFDRARARRAGPP